MQPNYHLCQVFRQDNFLENLTAANDKLETVQKGTMSWAGRNVKSKFIKWVVELDGFRIILGRPTPHESAGDFESGVDNGQVFNL